MEENFTTVKYEDMLWSHSRDSSNCVRWFWSDVLSTRRNGQISSPHPARLFLWGYLKDRVNQKKPAKLDGLKQIIRDEINSIDKGIIREVVAAFHFRIAPDIRLLFTIFSRSLIDLDLRPNFVARSRWYRNIFRLFISKLEVAI